MGFNFNREAAVKAGSSDYINESGVYYGKFVKAFETTYDSGAVSITFDFVSNDGKKANYLKIFTAKKGGSESFGVNHIYALMGILKLAKADPAKIDDEHTGYPMFCNKPVGVILQKEIKDDGKTNFSIVHFIDPVTSKTFSEIASNSEAKEYKKEVKDKFTKVAPDTSFNFGANVKSEPNNAQIDAMFGPSTDDSLPWENK